MRPLNLAQRPFKNERLQALSVGVAAVVLVALTAWQAFVVRKLLPRQTSSLHQEVSSLEQKLERFRDERKRIPATRPDVRTLAQWARVKGLVDQRMFSWTDLFASLEEVIPDGVRLTSIAPRTDKGEVEITLTAMVRSPDDGWEFVRVLEDHPEFSNVYPTSEADTGVFSYKMTYRSSAPWRAARIAAAEAAALRVDSLRAAGPGTEGMTP